MFKVDGKKITITKGDTASLTITATNRTFASEDRAVFTVANKGATTILFEQEYALNDGAFTVEFTNSETDKWAPGQYLWQVRYVFTPTRDQNNKINGGLGVQTPDDPQGFVVQAALSDF